MRAGLLRADLADDWQVLLSAGRDVDGTTWGSSTGVEGEGLALVVVLPVGADPGGRESTGTLEGNGGGIEEVVDVNVSELHADALADTSSLVEGNGGVDDLEAVELTRARSHDRVDTEGTDTMTLGRAGNDDLDGVGTRGEIDAAVGVVGRVVGMVGRDLVVGVAAVVAADQRSLEDEVAVVVNREGITRALNIGNAEDSGSHSDKVEGLGNSAASLAKVELVPATVDLELDGANSVVVVAAAALVVMVVGGGGGAADLRG